MAFWEDDKITPSQIIIISFILLIATGTLLLMLPFATQSGQSATLETALFTATSATCVTGLILQDTATYWSFFGQCVILLLIQTGGLGVVTTAIAISMLRGKKIGLKQRWVMQNSISAPQVGGIIRSTRFIVLASLIIEGTGAALLAFEFCGRLGFIKGLWYAVFHSVSAFCNAGFDLMGTVTGPFTSLTGYVGSGYVSGIICVLIIIGGLGFMVWHDIATLKLNFKAYRLQSKLVLITTAALLLGGFIFFRFYEFLLPQWGFLSGKEKLTAAVFQAVTPRTAGFNTVNHALFSEVGQLVVIMLMLIGGSPGSTAGGIKTSTFAVILLEIQAVFHHCDTAHCFGRRIPSEVFRKAAALLVLYIMLALTGAALICGIDGVPLLTALYETTSAIGTVGLSQGITAQLSGASHLILIFLMYFGRVGGLTMIYAIASGGAYCAVLPEEKVTVG